MAQLSEKRTAFVLEYLIDLNITQAAILAGDSAKRADAIGYENLRKPEIAKAMEERNQRVEISQDRVGYSCFAVICFDSGSRHSLGTSRHVLNGISSRLIRGKNIPSGAFPFATPVMGEG